MTAPLPRPYWRDMTAPEVAALDASAVVAILPVAAIEQHGPHLPLSTDADIVEGILARALAARPDGLPATALPPVLVGKSDEHDGFAGTLTLEAGTLGAVLTEIGAGVAASGVRRLALLNSHGGNPPVLEIAAGELRHHHGMMVVPVNTYHLYDPADEFAAEEARLGIHAGAIETSVMLHLKPDLVQMAEARDFESLTARMAGDYHHLSPQGRFGFAWKAGDLNSAGAVGNAMAADAAKGRALIEQAAARLLELLAEMHRAPLDLLK